MVIQSHAREGVGSGIRSSPSVFLAVTASTALLLWRLWKFWIAPSVHAERPQTLPYWVPWFGHIASFLRDGDGTITRARLHFGNTRRPFTLVLGGQNVYIITSAKDASTVFKSAAQLSFDSYLKDMTARFGVSATFLEVAWRKHASEKGKRTSSGEVAAHPGAAIAHAQFLPGVQMTALETTLLGKIHEAASWRKIPQQAVVDGSKDEKTISLQNWVRHVLIESMTRAFFGEAILQVEPKIVASLAQFDESSWKFTYQVPAVFSRTMLAAKDITQDGLHRYFELPPSERSDACWMIQALEAEMREVGATTRDVSASFMLIYWVMNTNAWKAAFWLIAHAIHDLSLKQRLEHEILPLFSANPALSPKKLQDRLEAIPLLSAAYNETLRTTAASLTVRDVLEKCIVGGTTLQQGSRLIIPYRQMLLDPDVFGPEAASFDADRFLHDPGLARNPSFRPFGGGLTFCPGRFLAQREIMTVAALFLGNYLAEMRDGERGLPGMDLNKPCLGVVAPRPGQDVLVRVRPRPI